MKKYSVRVNCACFEDFEIEANSKQEAARKAEELFRCHGNAPEAIESDIKVIKP